MEIQFLGNKDFLKLPKTAFLESHRITPCLAPCEVWHLTYRMGDELNDNE